VQEQRLEDSPIYQKKTEFREDEEVD